MCVKCSVSLEGRYERHKYIMYVKMYCYQYEIHLTSAASFPTHPVYIFYIYQKNV